MSNSFKDILSRALILYIITVAAVGCTQNASPPPPSETSHSLVVVSEGQGAVTPTPATFISPIGHVRCNSGLATRQKDVMVSFDITTTEDVPYFGAAKVHFYLRKPLSDEQIGRLPSYLRHESSGQHVNHLAFTIGLEKELTLPEWLTGGQEITLRFKEHDWPEAFVSVHRDDPWGTDEIDKTYYWYYRPWFTLAPGEQYVFRFHWPFSRESIESALQMKNKATYRLEWIADDQLLLHLEEVRDGYFTFANLQDVNGYDFYISEHFKLSLWAESPVVITAVVVSTGAEIYRHTVSVSLDGLTKVSPDFAYLTGYRYHQPGSQDLRREVIYDLITGRVVTVGALELNLAEHHINRKAEAVIKPNLTHQEGLLCHMPPSESRIVAFHYNPEDLSVYVLDIETGELTNYPLIYWPIQSKGRKMLWSHDDKYLIYDTRLPEGEAIVVCLDTDTGEQLQIFRGDTRPELTDVSPFGHHVGVGNEIVGFDGMQGATFPGRLVAWVSPTELIVSDGDAHYLFNLLNGAKNFIARGELFYYNREEGNAYFLERNSP